MSHNNLGEAAEPEMRPRSLVINNLTEEISDEVLQQELEVGSPFLRIKD